MVVLYLIGEKFEINRIYSEKEINLIIKNCINCRDVCSIRRDLIDASILKRDDNCTKYWKKLDFFLCVLCAWYDIFSNYY